MSSDPIRVNALRGHVKEDIFAKGSKSEHKAIFIKTADANYVLRRKIGPAYADSKLLRYVGHDVQCKGFLVNNTVLAEQIEIID